MDSVLTRFLDRHFDTLGDEEMDAYVRLLELIDTEFLEIVNGKRDVDDPDRSRSSTCCAQCNRRAGTTGLAYR